MTITMIAASFLGLLQIYLSYNVTKSRARTKVSMGDGGDPELTKAVRAHANLTEHAPIGLILVGLLEYRDANSLMVLILAAVLVVGRVMHAIGLGKLEGTNVFRFLGTLFTWLVILIASVVGLLSGYQLI